MNSLEKIEKIMDKFFNESFPELSIKSKKLLVKYFPRLALIGTLLTLYTIYNIYHWSDVVNNYLNYANNLQPYKTNITYHPNHLSIGLWIAILLLLISGISYLMAYQGLKKQTKKSWNLLFNGLLINLLYNLVIVFTLYGNSGSFIFSLILLGIGFYLLFQVRSAYISKNKSRN